MSPNSQIPVTTLKIEDKDCMDMRGAVKAIEEMLDYNFIDRKLLEMALTHPSCQNSISGSYQRLEFLGDAALGSMIAIYVYDVYPDQDPGDLSLVKSANVSTENLARVAVRTGLYKYVLHNVSSMDDKVKEFLQVVKEEENIVVHGGAMKAPKVLADIVESVVAAVFVDLQFDFRATWKVVNPLFEPLITLDMLQQQPQPIKMLFELCQKNGQQVEFKHGREDDKNFSNVYVDSKLIVTVSSDRPKENVKLHAAVAALEKLGHYKHKMDIYSSWFENGEIKAPKRKLNEISRKKKWSKPTYRIEKQVGPAHDKTYVCSVNLNVDDELFYKEGEEKPKLKDAEGSAAQAMLFTLREKSYV